MGCLSTVDPFNRHCRKDDRRYNESGQNADQEKARHSDRFWGGDDQLLCHGQAEFKHQDLQI